MNPPGPVSFDLERAASTFSGLGATAVGSAIDASMSVLAAATRPIISFAMGSPAADAIPTLEIADALERILGSRTAASALDYSPTEGNPALRQALLGWLRAGREIHPDCLIVTAGGMQGLDLVYRLFLDPGDLVLAESPSYANGTATARNHGAELVQIPLDDEGMDIEAARRAIRDAGRPPRLLYLIPTYQNPAGSSYTVRRRLEIIELARETGAVIIEDDPYSELRYEGGDLPQSPGARRRPGPRDTGPDLLKDDRPGTPGWLGRRPARGRCPHGQPPPDDGHVCQLACPDGRG